MRFLVTSDGSSLPDLHLGGVSLDQKGLDRSFWSLVWGCEGVVFHRFDSGFLPASGQWKRDGDHDLGGGGRSV